MTRKPLHDGVDFDYLELHRRVEALGWWMVRTAGRRRPNWRWYVHPPASSHYPSPAARWAAVLKDVTTAQVAEWLLEKERAA